MAVLGSTLEAIATEKAAVVRAGGRVVSAAQPREAAAVIERMCRERAAQLWTVGREWAVEVIEESSEGIVFDMHGPAVAYERLRVPLAGAHQAANAATAVAALSALASRYANVRAAAIRRGLAATRWPGRLQVAARDPLVLLDAAHNRESAAALAAALARLYPAQAFVLVVAIFRDKDGGAVLAPLPPLASRVVC